jgi:hypothetical protein
LPSNRSSTTQVALQDALQGIQASIVRADIPAGKVRMRYTC